MFLVTIFSTVGIICQSVAASSDRCVRELDLIKKMEQLIATQNTGSEKIISQYIAKISNLDALVTSDGEILDCSEFSDQIDQSHINLTDRRDPHSISFRMYDKSDGANIHPDNNKIDLSEINKHLYIGYYSDEKIGEPSSTMSNIEACNSIIENLSKIDNVIFNGFYEYANKNLLVNNFSGNIDGYKVFDCKKTHWSNTNLSIKYFLDPSIEIDGYNDYEDTKLCHSTKKHYYENKSTILNAVYEGRRVGSDALLLLKTISKETFANCRIKFKK